MISMRGTTVPLLLALSFPAQAATVAVTAPINNGVDPKTVLGAHQLMASELDFQEGVEGVTDLTEMPPSLNPACLSSTACLKGITNSAGTNWLVTGQMTAQGNQIALDLLLFDGSQIVRRKTWNVKNDATALANEMTPILKELITGKDPNAGRGGAVAAGTFKADDDFSFDEPTGDPEVDDLMDIDSLDDLDEKEERQAAGAAVVAAPAAVGAAAAGAGAAAASQATGGAVTDEDVLSMINFGGGGGGAAGAAAAASPVPSSVAAAAQNPMGAAQGAANTAIDNVIANNTPQTGNAMADKAIGGAAAAAASAAKGLIDLDSKEKKGGTVVRDGSETVNITVRGGYSTYYKFQFVTGGAEVGVAPAPIPLNLVLGVEVYNVQRTLPPEVQVQTGQIFEWNQIFPVNFGLLYRIDTGSPFRPYVGADGILVQYYRDEQGGDWAAGPRARAGADFFFNQNFGLNVNLAAGMWVGQNWDLIEPGVGESGILPQVSAGAVAAF